jgi:hypothetical protein
MSGSEDFGELKSTVLQSGPVAATAFPPFIDVSVVVAVESAAAMVVESFPFLLKRKYIIASATRANNSHTHQGVPLLGFTSK